MLFIHPLKQLHDMGQGKEMHTDHQLGTVCLRVNAEGRHVHESAWFTNSRQLPVELFRQGPVLKHSLDDQVSVLQLGCSGYNRPSQVQEPPRIL